MQIGNKIIAAVSGLAFMFSAGIAAAENLTLRSDISIIDDIVTLGDLFENAGDVAKIAVFKSPRLGKKGILKSRRIRVAARDHGLNWLNPKYLENIVVVREANTIDLDEISQRIREELSSRYPLKAANSKLEISLSTKAVPFVMRADVDPVFEILKIRYNQRSGRFSVTVSGPLGSAYARRMSYTGRAMEMVEVPVLIATLARGQTIRAHHLEMKKISARYMNGRTVKETADLIGMAARRSLRPNSVIRINDVEKPKLVRKNALISVVYRIGALQIVFRGQALEDGVYGETVRILNPRSRRTIQASVTGQNMVTTQGNFYRKTASLTQ